MLLYKHAFDDGTKEKSDVGNNCQRSAIVHLN